MSRKLSLKSPYAVILLLLCLIALMEARHPFPSFRLATFILAFLALAGMASRLRGKPRDGLVVLASLAFGLSIIEATAAIRETKEVCVVTNGESVPQPIVGWGPEHAGRFHAEKTDPKSGVPIYRVDYTIDSNLLRETHSVETGPTIVFFRRFLYFWRRSERCRHASAALRGFAKTQAKSAQSWLFRLWTAAILGGIADGPF